jgi:hypothetical protein
VAIGIGLAAAVLLIGLAVWPRPSGISGTVSQWVCKPGPVLNCGPRPVVAQVRVTDCYSGFLTSNNPLDNAIWETRSDSHGRYHIDLAPGAYCVFAFKDGTPDFPATANATVTVHGGDVAKVDLAIGVPYGICLAAQDMIATPSGQVLVSQLHAGMIVWTLDPTGHRVAASLLMVSHAPAPPGHRVVRLVLADGRVVEASPGHPTADGRWVGDLNVGNTLAGSRIVRADRLPYVGDTWDLLPAGPTGVYWAGGIPLKSTLLQIQGR